MLKKLIIISFVCFCVSPALFAYDEFAEKKHQTFDGKIFEIREVEINILQQESVLEAVRAKVVVVTDLPHQTRKRIERLQRGNNFINQQ